MVRSNVIYNAICYNIMLRYVYIYIYVYTHICIIYITIMYIYVYRSNHRTSMPVKGGKVVAECNTVI